ncbi:hypothetical protein [Rhodopirellula sallentina]|uniref:Uncharacterized protein n=1 Tax=Rhodopirellula sallentina SM41 TaxID=1263870 RepID=M5UG04_9BACT|nr:hypothetical protein [Rhodopirellula sallentina]EMI56766.1 hypothetical protein RSSM_01806 [Rhodopirellula sallentina SM41]
MTARIRCNAKPFGELFSCNRSGTPIEWTPTDFAQLPLEFSIVGDIERPVFQAAKTILDIIAQPRRIEMAALSFVRRNSLAFAEWISTFELEHACFDDTVDSSVYIATCLTDFTPQALAYPAIGCVGNGYWKLKFRMRRFDVVQLIVDDAP